MKRLIIGLFLYVTVKEKKNTCSVTLFSKIEGLVLLEI